MYGLLLIDEFDTPYSTAHVITDKVLWDWIHAPENFNGASSMQVALPVGYLTEEGTTTANITVGTPNNDKAQTLVGAVRPDGNDALVELEFDTDAEDDEEAGEGNSQFVEDALKAFANQGITEVYRGAWY